jgi:multisubunit Na+/H+ antiporter MnhB subunit
MSYLIDRFFGWMTVQPTLGLLMVVVALGLFAVALNRNTDKSNSLWPWIRRLIESSISAVLFLGLLWTFRNVLTNTSSTFNSTHGSLSDVNLRSAQSIWGVRTSSAR